MKNAIVYHSRTGNTVLLAQVIKEALNVADENLYTNGNKEEALQADRLFIGFWTDKGNCDEDLIQFLKQVHHKQIFFFGSAGFGNDPNYFTQILNRVKSNLPQDNKVIGSFMCQGKMSMSVRDRYVQMLAQNDKMQVMIENFDRALSHPDEEDVEKLRILMKQL